MNTKQWIVVTGAANGIGRAAAERLIQEGFGVVATSRNQSRLTELYAKHEAVKIIPWDLSDIQNIKEYTKKVNEEVGAVAGMLHCAGIQSTLPIHMMKESKLQEVFNINTFAAMMLVGSFAKKNMTDKGASFVLISSLAAHEGAFGKAVYAASKGALEGFIKAAAPELAEKNIRINCLAPGVVKTEMVENYFKQLSEEQKNSTIKEYPLGMGEPQDIAELITFLLTNRSKWITGQTVIIDGGHMIRKC